MVSDENPNTQPKRRMVAGSFMAEEEQLEIFLLLE